MDKANNWAEYCKRAYKGHFDTSHTKAPRVSFGDMPVIIRSEQLKNLKD